MGKVILIAAFLFMLISCGTNEENAIPKPKGFMRLNIPQAKNIIYSSACPFEFEYPDFFKIEEVKDKNQKCWFNLTMPSLNGKIHFTYSDLDNNLARFIEDARGYAYKHSAKAQYINERIFANPNNNAYGIMYEIGGNAASSCQFFVTDSTQHFLRGALYFNNVPNADSIKPINDYVLSAIQHLIETTRWK